MNRVILELRALSKYYISEHAVVVGLNSVDLSFRVGEFVAVTGESGSGKSTLAHVLAGILPYENGELLIDGSPTSHYDGADWEAYRRDKISFISQNYGILEGLSVGENVTSALRILGFSPEEAKKQAEEILHRVDLFELRHRLAAKLSSGQKQRLSIARALAKPASVLIADEPTGNLDRENSEKVIRLLADAARDRLVILITHEFEEVAAYATRRLTLSDGKVITDAPLREPNVPEKRKTDTKRRPPKHLSFFTARLQLSMRPVWCTVMLLFLTLTAFAVFAFWGTFITHLDDTYTYYYNNTAFRNGNELRVVVMRSDKGDMTDEDAAQLAALSHVEQVERYGYVTDITLAYREDMDYEIRYTVINIAPPSSLSPIYETKKSITLLGDHAFLQTVPYPVSAEFLTAGRMPENFFECVVSDSSYSLGDPVTVFLQDSKNWRSEEYIEAELTVVGLTETGSGLYVSDTLAAAVTTAVRDGASYLCVPNPEIPYSDSSTPFFRYPERCANKYYSFNDPSPLISFYPTADNSSSFRLTPDPVSPFTETLSTADKYIEVAPEIFETMVRSGYGDQMSLTVAAYAYAERVINAAQRAGYIAVSPYILGATRQNPELAEERMNTLTICMFAAAVILLLEILLLRVLFGAESNSFQLLSNIGLTSNPAVRSVWLQTFFFAFLGQLLAVGIVALCWAAGVDRIIYVVQYLPPRFIALLSLLHFLQAAIGAAWAAHAMRRTVFPFAAGYSDIDSADKEA